MSAKKHTILIVDDEPDVLFSLTGLLRREFQVYTAASGAAALEIMSEHPVDVVMTDQRMPSMTGTELMSRVKAEHPRAVRIVFTGYADTRAVIDAINAGELYRYITKPWDPEDLIEVLREAANKHDELAAQETLVCELPGLLGDTERMIGESTHLDGALVDGLRLRIEHVRQLLGRLNA